MNPPTRNSVLSQLSRLLAQMYSLQETEKDVLFSVATVLIETAEVKLRQGAQQSNSSITPLAARAKYSRKRTGPKPRTEEHNRLSHIVANYEDWTGLTSLKIAEQLDKERTLRGPKRWKLSWFRMVQENRPTMVKTLRYGLVPIFDTTG